MRQDCLKHAFAILDHLVVPEAKHLPPLARQISVTDNVTKVFCVLRAVGFDNELSPNAKKVDNVGADWDLPAKLESAKATIAQQAPQAKLGVSRRSTHRSGARALVRRDACVSLHRSSIGGAALIRPRSARPPSRRGRRGSRHGVWHIPSPKGERAHALPFGATLLPRGEGGRRSRSDEGAWVTTS
jgi:hypothetical protein